MPNNVSYIRNRRIDCKVHTITDSRIYLSAACELTHGGFYGNITISTYKKREHR